MTYQRQLRSTGANVVVLCLAAVFPLTGLLFFFPMVIFGPIILLVTLIQTGFVTFRWIFKGNLEFVDGQEMFFAGWSLAPLAALWALPFAIAGPRFNGWFGWSFAETPGESGIKGALAGLAVFVVLSVIWLMRRNYAATPAHAHEKTGGELSGKGLSAAALQAGMYIFGLTLFLAAPAGTLLGVLYFLSGEKISTAGLAFLAVAAVPALLMGTMLLRRGMWIWRLEQNIHNLPTANPSSAAMGLAEIRGRAAVPGNPSANAPILFLCRDAESTLQEIAGPFDLVDEAGGRLRVNIGSEELRGPFVHLCCHGKREGTWEERILMPGDEIYAMGELVPERGGTAVLRPWRPPFRGLLLPFASAMLTQQWSFAAGLCVDDILRLRFPAEIFFLSDQGEDSVKGEMRRARRHNLIWGGFVMAGALGLLAVSVLLQPK